ncbi:3 beta-hydroxysteroid dehydrogenase/Delta 5--_4-isomerase-like isoform X2 [Pelobates fuscus]|uniref:3 beta-hydroxysteroid dehydrogenase/Delta 5-->4-isomerase-like isoform X2 n=1 Tax=Pelobates fuscus TaxID=191477 RepID=UPI002FE4954E
MEFFPKVIMAMPLAGMRCLVTGAGGFLGQRIVRFLLEEGEMEEIRAMDKVISSDLLAICEQFKGRKLVKLLQGDICDEDFLQQCCQSVDVVIHSAAIIDPMEKISTETLIAINVTENLLEACVQNDVRYFIFTSSVEVVGPNTSGDPIVNGHEDLVYVGKLRSPYGQSKRLAEERVLKANGRALKSGGILITCSLRPMYIYGEGSQFLEMHLVQAISNGNVFHRLSRKEALVNPVYVGNVAWAHVQAARAMNDPDKAKKIAGNFYYISDDTPHISYSDINHELGKELGLGVEPRLTLPFNLLYYAAFLLEVLRFLLKPFVRYVPPFTRHLVLLLNTAFTFSYNKAQRDMGYKPHYTWEESKQLTTTWMASVMANQKEQLRKSKSN